MKQTRSNDDSSRISNRSKNPTTLTLKKLFTIDTKQPILEQLTNHNTKTMHLDIRDLVLFPLYMTCKRLSLVVLEYINLPETIWIWFVRSDFVRSYVFFHYHDVDYLQWIKDIGLKLTWYRRSMESKFIRGWYLFDDPLKLEPNILTTMNYLQFIKDQGDYEGIPESVLVFAQKKRKYELLSFIADTFGPGILKTTCCKMGLFETAAGYSVSTFLESTYDANDFINSMKVNMRRLESIRRLNFVISIRTKQIEKVLDLLEKYPGDLCFMDYIFEAIEIDNLYLIEILTERYFKQGNNSSEEDRQRCIKLAIKHTHNLKLIAYLYKKYPPNKYMCITDNLMKHIVDNDKQDILLYLIEVDEHPRIEDYRELFIYCSKYHQISLMRRIEKILIDREATIIFTQTELDISIPERVADIKRIRVTDDDILWLLDKNLTPAPHFTSSRKKCITNICAYMLLNSKLEFIKLVFGDAKLGVKIDILFRGDTCVDACLIINKRHDVLLWLKELDAASHCYIRYLETALQYHAYDMALFLHEKCISGRALELPLRSGPRICIGDDIMAYLWLLEHGYLTTSPFFVSIVAYRKLETFIIHRHQIGEVSLFECLPMKWISQ